MTTENPFAGQGMVVLDIGDDIGALVISTPAALAGVEIEICPTGRRYETPDEGGDWWWGQWRGHSHETHSHDAHGHDAHGHHHGPAWPHVAVIARPTPVGTEHAAVFPGLRDGSYDLWVRPDGATALTVRAEGGRVTSASWPERA
jgi:hypothetical protein